MTGKQRAPEIIPGFLPFSELSRQKVLRKIADSKNMKVLEATLLHVNEPVISVRIGRHEEEAFLKHKVPSVADDPLDHLVIVEIDPHPQSRNDRSILVEMKRAMTPVAVERLDEEHCLGRLRRNVFHPIRIQSSEPNRVQGRRVTVSQQFLD